MDLVYIAAGIALFAAFGVYAVPLEARLTMILAAIYIVATVGVTLYMLAALIRPEDF